jgi:hypothetical protein
MTTEETQDKPVRKTPTVRKSTVINDSTVVAPKRNRTNSSTNEVSSPKQKLSQNSKTVFLMIASFFVGSFLTYFYSTSSPSTPAASTTTFTELIAGKVALTENELVDAVKQLGVDVYWAGPVKGAMYTLAVPAEGQAYVRYLPNGDGIDDTKPNYVVIATYTTTDAFSATQAAGNQSNGVTFVNTEGAAVYYNKDVPTNVYVAYPNLNYQIEVFSPIAATALDIASKQSALKVVK